MADEHEELVLEEIRRSAESGDAISRAELQESCGLGAGDLDSALEGLRERDVIEEESPDEFTLGDAAAAARAVKAAERAAVGDDDDLEDDELDEDDQRAEPEPPPAATEVSARRARAARQRTGHVGEQSAVREDETRLTTAMIDALTPEGLGELVKAGVSGMDGEEFVLRVRR